MRFLSIFLLILISSNIYAECIQTGNSVKRKFRIIGECKEAISPNGFCVAGSCFSTPNYFNQHSTIPDRKTCTAKVRLIQVKTYKGDCKRNRKVKRLSNVNVGIIEYRDNEITEIISEGLTNKKGIALIPFTYNSLACTYNPARLRKNNKIGIGFGNIYTKAFLENEVCY